MEGARRHVAEAPARQRPGLDRPLLHDVGALFPADLLAIEHSGAYNGRYFALMGQLSPIDGIGPVQLGLDLLEQRLQNEPIEELVLATSVTVEGDATAQLVAALARRFGVKASRIAYGVPVGGELEFVDSSTLSRALAGRRGIESGEEVIKSG